MAGRQIFDPCAFRNVEKDGKIIGYSFAFKAQYYRSITLSIVRDLTVEVDGEKAAREDIRLTVNGQPFTLEEMRTVIDPEYRWEFGDFATVTVLKDGGLTKGPHHLRAHQSIAPSYMPFTIEKDCDADFDIA